MATPDSTLVQTPAPAYHDEATIPRGAARVRVIAFPWQRLALGAILLMAAILNIWDLSREGYANTYYAAAVKSMLQSWHNFFFVSFDPGGFVSIDKPPLGFWIETASAKLFGFSGLSILLPEALAGVLSVAVLYRLVARTWGRGAGLLAALFLAVTPVSVVTARNNTIDSVLVLAVLLAAWAVLRAAETGRLRWLLAGAVLVGLGFNIKMLEAYLVVPAFGLMYLVGARTAWRRRIVHLLLALVVLLGVSLSWATAVDLTPAAQRPYVGSSGTNSELNLALGYNGLQRLTGTLFSHGPRPAASSAKATTGSTSTATSTSGSSGGPNGGPGGPGGGNGLFNGGPAGPFRLLGTTLGGQVGWLLVLAVLGLVAAATTVSWRRPDGRARSLVLWGTWLLTASAFFSVAEFFHPYYTVMLAPAIAALAAIGVATLWRAYRGAGWRGWLLPLVLLATAGVEAYILRDYPDWNRWLTPLVIGTGLIASVALVIARLRPRQRIRVGLVASGAAVGSLLAAPAAWAAYSTTHQVNSTIPTAGPPAQGADNGPGGFGSPSGTRFGGAPGGTNPSAGSSGGPAAPGGNGFGPGQGGPGGDTANSALITYLEAHQGTTKYLVATTSSQSAAPIIIVTGKPVMALGGFSGSDKILTTQQLAALVKQGTVRYFLLQSGGPGGAGGFGGPGGTPSGSQTGGTPSTTRAGFAQSGAGPDGNSSLTQWVISNCATVPSSQWQTSSGTGGFGGGGQLYDCASHSTGQSSATAASGSQSTAGSASHPSTTTTAPSTALRATAVPSAYTPTASRPAHMATPVPQATQTRPATQANAPAAHATVASGRLAVGGEAGIMGQWVSGTAQSVTVRTMQGQQLVPTTGQTRYYRVEQATAGTLAVGQRVAIISGTGTTATAASITILPAGSPAVAASAGGPGGSGSGAPGPGSGASGGNNPPPAGATPPSGGPAGNPGGPGAAPGNGTGAPGAAGGPMPAAKIGTVTAINGQSLAVKLASTGATATVKLASSTTVYRLAPTTRSSFQAGTFVAIATARIGSRQTATSIVGSGSGVQVLPVR